MVFAPGRMRAKQTLPSQCRRQEDSLQPLYRNPCVSCERYSLSPSARGIVPGEIFDDALELVVGCDGSLIFHVRHFTFPGTTAHSKGRKVIWPVAFGTNRNDGCFSWSIGQILHRACR